MNSLELESLDAENDTYTCMRCYMSVIGFSSYIKHKQELCPIATLKPATPRRTRNEESGDTNTEPAALPVSLPDDGSPENFTESQTFSEKSPESPVYNNCEIGESDSKHFSPGKVKNGSSVAKTQRPQPGPSKLPKYNILGFNCYTGLAFVLGKSGTINIVRESQQDKKMHKQIKELSGTLLTSNSLHNSKNNSADLQCKQCDARFEAKQQYTNHLRNTHGLAAYACTFCNLKFQKITLLKQHLQLHQTGQQESKTHPFQNINQHSPDSLDHIKLMYPVISLPKLEIDATDTVIVRLKKRNLSPERAINDQELDNSIDAGYDPIEEIKKMKISSTSNQSPTTEQRHQSEEEHQEEGSNGQRGTDTVCMLCTLCTLIFPSESLLADHIAHVHNHSGGSRSGDSFCHTCGMPLEGAEALQAHLPSELHRAMAKEVVGNQPWPGRAIRYSEMALKKVSAHGGRRYQCPLCHIKLTDSREIVRNHMWTHAAVKPFQCNLCVYSACKNHNLHTHLIHHMDSGTPPHRLHPDEGSNIKGVVPTKPPPGQAPYKCIYKACQKVLKNKSALTNHMKSHTPSLAKQRAKTGGTSIRYLNQQSNQKLKCKDCNYTTKDLNSLKHHSKIHNKKTSNVKNRFKCTFKGCTYAARDNYNLRVHSKMHDVNRKKIIKIHKPFKCKVKGGSYVQHLYSRARCSQAKFKCHHKQCSYVAINQYSLNSHQRVHKNNEPNFTKKHKCNHKGCSFTTIAMGNLTRHRRIHTNEKPYKCHHKGCSYATVRKDGLISHQQRLHKNMPNYIKEHKCNHKGCSYSSHSVWRIRRHSVIHSDLRHFKCHHKACSYAGKRKEDLISHQRVHKNIPKYNKELKCNHQGCSFTTNFSVIMKRHSKIHTNEKLYKCNHKGCSYSSNSLGNTRRHSVIHSNLRPFKCHHKACSYAASRKQDLIFHQRVHKNKKKPNFNKELKCNHQGCSFTTNFSSSMKRHSKIHTNEKLYKCNHKGCSYATNDSGNMRRHSRTHTNEKAFKCHHKGCGYAANRKDGLQSHQRLVHNKAIQFKCPHCSYTCSSRLNLIWHIKTSDKHKGRALFICPFCPTTEKFQTNIQNKYSKHLSTIHRDMNIGIPSAISLKSV